MFLQNCRQGLYQITLPGERMQTLDVDQQIRRADSERFSSLAAFLPSVKVKCRRHCRVDDRAARPLETQLARPIVQALAVERDRVGMTVSVGEQVHAALAAVVPDLSAIQRQHHGTTHLPGKARAHLRQQSIAVNMYDVGVAEKPRSFTPNQARARNRAGAEEAL